ncbi:MAG: lipid-A-disaccharide synthase-related protein [Candidatus Eremiobacteraeota bacterium]|nr:lipid-A-disaccharide synthase-related protein [Candidatus Eremiobacteraeota bacterium]
MAPRILFISNGYGEDTIATSVVKALLAIDVSSIITALPLVGEGKAYEACGVEVIGPRQLMPSGGMIPGNPGNLLKDIACGLGSLTAAQALAIKHMKGHVDVTAAVGDIYPVLMAMLFAAPPRVMIGTAKSNYFVPYNGFERAVIRRSCEVAFVRDEPTAASLRASRIDARWVGNAMMDSLDYEGQTFGLREGLPCVGILPGSRAEAYGDIAVILEAVEELYTICEGKVAFLMGAALSTPLEEFSRKIAPMGWRFREGQSFPSGSMDYFDKEPVSIAVVRGMFGDVLKCSTVLIGQAGTGNEQAVGLGKPVVTFDSQGRQELGWYRKRQKGLLGDSIAVVAKEKGAIAAEVSAILSIPERYRSMAAIGYERMGPPGGARAMALSLLEHAGAAQARAPGS